MSSTIIRTIDILLCVKIILIIIPTRMSENIFLLAILYVCIYYTLCITRVNACLILYVIKI